MRPDDETDILTRLSKIIFGLKSKEVPVIYLNNIYRKVILEVNKFIITKHGVDMLNSFPYETRACTN